MAAQYCWVLKEKFENLYKVSVWLLFNLDNRNKQKKKTKQEKKNKELEETFDTIWNNWLGTAAAAAAAAAAAVPALQRNGGFSKTERIVGNAKFDLIKKEQIKLNLWPTLPLNCAVI